eukprot:4840642-Pyramimonas_sp.AAC.1
MAMQYAAGKLDKDQMTAKKTQILKKAKPAAVTAMKKPAAATTAKKLGKLNMNADQEDDDAESSDGGRGPTPKMNMTTLSMRS